MHRVSQATLSPYPMRPMLTRIAVLIVIAGFSTQFPTLAQTRMAPLEVGRIPAGVSVIRFRTPLDTGELFLLKAVDTAKSGTDIGVEVATSAQGTLPGGGAERAHWFGGNRSDHTYYMIVTGAGQPPTLHRRVGSGAGPGAIGVSLYRLSPGPVSLARPLEELPVPVLERTVSTSLMTRRGAVYLLQASGSGHVGGGGIAQGDAEYMDYKTDGTGSEDIGDAHTDYGLGVDEADQTQTPRLRKWGPWRGDHTYYMLFAGTGRPIRFFFYDVKGGYGDNSPTDTLTVRIFPVP